MTTFKTLLLAAALAAPAAIVSTSATAQVGGVAVADPEAAVANSKAWATARTQIQTTYKAQIDQANARRQAISTELQPLVDAYQKAAAAPGATEASLRSQATAIQTKEQAGNAELQRLTAPASRAQAYALEQISAKLPDAVSAAVRAKNVSLLLRPNAALFAQPTADITSAITAELDRTVPTVGITPPANWQPGQQQQQGAAAAAPAAPAQEPPPIVVRAPEPAQPQTPATMVVEPVAMMIATFDANGDALVDRSEMIDGVRASFEAIDTAHTGALRYIAYSDWAATFLGDANALPSPYEVDRNNDGQVTLDELLDQFSRLFARYDKDGSKTISRAELLTFRTMPIGADGPTMGRGAPRGKGKPDAGAVPRGGHDPRAPEPDDKADGDREGGNGAGGR
ncbi:OmpH family outer membrane protein [Sphingomonas sp. CCH9-F2]|uniref:OmpH family outer membrane protein n=2 Tax=Sphingomonas TaxID=13687 RepID=UPI0009EB8C9A|nr:OmpH family outer membrane protein [Sphingomonas sp. CCH9-F2]